LDRPEIDETLLTSIARRVLDRPAATLVSWQLEPSTYRVINRVTAGLFRIAGTADDRGLTRSWSVFLKVLHHPSVDESSAFNTSDDPAHWNYWRREALVYTSDLLRDLPASLRAPRCFAATELSAGTIGLWMEDIRNIPATAWPLDRFGLAAQHLGQFQGGYLMQPSLPRMPWLSRNWLHAWVPDISARLDLIQDPTAWHHPLLSLLFAPDTADSVLRLWHDRELLLAAVGRVPQTLCHLDFWPPNLFARTTDSGGDQTVLIDWSQTGIGALAEDIANLVMDSVWMLYMDGALIEQFEAIVFAGYMSGLRQAGWAGDQRQVRFAYAAVAALRFGLLAGALLRYVHTADLPMQLEQQYQRSFNDIVVQRAHMVSHALALGEEARSLLGVV
jgi:Phosphotransferase enzyme family